MRFLLTLLSSNANSAPLEKQGENLTLTFNFNFIYYLTKEKVQNGRFPQIASASRGGKRQERIGYITACQICTKFEEHNRKVALKVLT